MVNHHENLGLTRISGAGQLTIPDGAGMSPNPLGNNTKTRSSKRHQASRASDFSYQLVCSTVFSSLTHISLFLVHNSTIIAEHKDKSSLSISQCHDHKFTPSTAYAEYTIHRVQHPPRMVCLPFILTIMSWPLNGASTSAVPPSTIDCHQPALHESSKLQSACHIPTGASELTDELSLNTRRAIHQPASSTHPISLDHSFKLHISNLSRSWPPSVSPDLLDYGLQVCTIMASKCISKLCWLWPPSSHDHGLQCISPNSLDQGIQVYLQPRSIADSKFARSRSPSASPNLLAHDLGVHLKVHLITTPKCSSNDALLPLPSSSANSLDHSLGVYLGVHSIVIFSCTPNCSQALPAASPDIPCVDG